MSWVDKILGKIRPEETADPVAYVPKTVWAKPGISQEQFAEVRQTDNFPAQRRIVGQNNRAVTRDYGNGPIDESNGSRHDAEGPMTLEDLKLTGCNVVEVDVELTDAEKDALLGGRMDDAGYEIGPK